ncbi:amidase family protein [Granulosicoccus antarcticus]|uniref:Amidase AmiD n=1 Tax=Granulosicoccus antarcticus IMCC3135 TaxID=1192854 RepID=A0A2Z2NNA1_9GAMM|nr:amidase family protein [Granulosicoccus antarcticus]ASJ72703.1 Putative amidase AmiD [Granulosicoccus antarcticus IMCC3135]
MTSSYPWTPDSAPIRVADLQARLDSDDPALRHVFTEIFHDPIAGQSPINNPLNGALVSVKELFDVKGHVTRAGTRFMAEDAPAVADALPIQRLRAAGAVMLGTTNMTELAYSGLGLNPHNGTPENAIHAGCIPGGSTSGGAISVARGVADIAVGTDTGGSLRIPAAFNGIVGFKPTQATVSRQGCKSLSQTLDSIGPMAASVETCSQAYQVMRDDSATTEREIDPVFIIPDNYGMDDLEPEVAAAFTHAVLRLRDAGHDVRTQSLASLERLKSLAVWQIAAVEAYAEYHEALQSYPDQFDPRVSSRIARAQTLSALEYRTTLNARNDLIRQYQAEMMGKVLLMPTVPILPPSMSVFDNDDTYARLNVQVLRNPSIANVMDCCSISLPVIHEGNATGLMLTAQAFSDQALLQLAALCEALLEA